MSPFVSGQPRRLPFPYDIRINGQGFMLWSPPTLDSRYSVQPRGIYSAEHPTPLTNAQPSDLKPSSQNPAIDSEFTWNDFSLGMGLRQQVGDNDRRYRFADQADCSIQGQVIWGPLISSITPSTVDATNGISGFFEIGGKLYAVNGRYVHLRTSDADWNTSRKDLGSGKAALDHVHFFTNAGGGADYVYVAMGDSEFLWRFDGTTWTQHGSLYARAFCMQGRNLWRASATNALAKVDVDAEPWTAGNWQTANSFTIGEKGSGITRVVLNAAGVLLVLKTDGVYTLDEQGQDHQLFPGMRFAISSENGKYPYLAENWVYTTYGNTHYRIDPSMTIEPIGPEQYADNDSQVKGYITAGVGTQFANYAGIYNPDNGHSYLLKFGAWVNDETGSKRIDAWHGSLSATTLASSKPYTNTATFASDKITAMWRSTIGATSGHERVYIGMLSGKIYWFQLPCTPNPFNCSSYTYMNTGATSYCSVFLPYWHGGFQDNKTVKAFSVQAVGNASEAGSVNFNTRTAGEGGNYNSTPQVSTYNGVPGGRAAVNLVYSLMDAAVVLQTGAGASSSTSTQVNSIGIAYQTRPPIAEVYQEFNILAENGLRRRDGVPVRIGADKITSLLKAACATAVGVTVVTADETSQTLILQNYTEHQRWDNDLKQYRNIVSFIGVTTDRSSSTLVQALS